MNSAVPVGPRFIRFATIIDWLLRYLSFLFQAHTVHISTNMQNGDCIEKQRTLKKTQLQPSKPEIHIFFHEATAPSGPRSPHY